MCLSNLQSLKNPTNKDRVETLGTGMARKAGEAMNNRPAYMQYVADAQAQGQAPVPYEAWVKQQSGGP